MAETIVIVGAKRTPIGSMQGKFNSVTASQLGAVAIKAAIEQAGVKPTEVDDLIFGNVLGAGQGQAPARQAALGAGLDKSTPATTINKMCGSGMKAAMMAADELSSGNATIVVAGGMESMTNAPHLLPKGRGGIRYGHGQVLDHMAFDGLENAYDGKPMGFSPTRRRRNTASRASRWTRTRRNRPSAPWARPSPAPSPMRSPRSR